MKLNFDIGGYTGYTFKMSKVLISIDNRLLRRIDRMARSSGLSRSAYIARLALREATSLPRRASTQNALDRLDRLFAHAPSGDSTAEIRTERAAR